MIETFKRKRYKVKGKPLQFHQSTNLVEIKQKHVDEENEYVFYKHLIHVKVDDFVVSVLLCYC